MFPNTGDDQLREYFEAKKRKAGNQLPERGYSGAGYWYAGYPVYIGTMALNGALTTATPDNDQAQPDADSKVEGAAAEAVGSDSNASMAANTAPAGA